MFEEIGIALGILIPMSIMIIHIHRENVKLKVNIHNEAHDEAHKTFEDWKQTQLNSLQEQYKSQVNDIQGQYTKQLAENKIEIRNNIETQFQTSFQQWKQDEESNIREDAITRSQDVIRGHVTEQFAPYLPEFNLNPKDARFIGSPLDFIVFDGLSEGELKRIVIVEVKSGESQMNQRERQVRKCIENNLIEYRIIRIRFNKNEDGKKND